MTYITYQIELSQCIKQGTKILTFRSKCFSNSPFCLYSLSESYIFFGIENLNGDMIEWRAKMLIDFCCVWYYFGKNKNMTNRMRHRSIVLCVRFERYVVSQYSETNVMHFLFGLLRIKGLCMFRTLLAHLQEVLHKRHLVYCVGVVGVERNCRSSQQTWHAHNTPSVVCVEPPEDEQVMIETCRGP
jgi:hypothetical protein